MKPKTAEKSDSTHPKRQNESTRERVLEAAFTLFCEHGFSDGEEIAIRRRKRKIQWQRRSYNSGNQKAKPDEPERVGNRQCDKRF